MTLAQNSKNFQAMKEQGLVVPTPSTKPDMPVPPITAPYPNPNFSSGPLPAISMMQPDMQRTFYSPAAAQDRLAPPSATNNAVTGAQAISQTILNVGSGGNGVLLETNNQKNAVQSVLNLVAGTNISLSSDARGDVTIASTASGASDGLTHAFTPWEGDPSNITLWDEFVSNPNTANNSGTAIIGSLGWFISGNATITGNINGSMGGVPPYLGQYNWANTGTVSQTGFLTFPGGNTSGNFSQQTWALFDNPGWIMRFVFRVEPANSSTSRNFTFTKKALYIGLMGNTGTSYASSSKSRPAVFIGIRYDTSTTAPSINDSFYTLEVVANNEPSVSARNNTQGTTLVTSVAPVAGVWHRLDIICNTAGKVTLTLDGSNTNTLTTTIPTYTLSGTINAVAGSGNAHISWTTGSIGQGAWTTGSKITLAGFSTSALNNTFQASDVEAGDFDFDSGLTVVSDTGSSIAGYPSVIPVFGFGNDDTTPNPPASTASISVDFWSFVWNPNLGPSAPGTPNPMLPRGF